ncbi:MAG: large subunit ribosomal protein L5 [Parcubacteria group bacterium Gr01-1014_18]|nr:MAG: large subunit ribosomal protein L5 [Parcubacteria group bacterium Greene0416_36]TSC80264.1 MAG: large subunit ribosomal protein L5 [Parcubacteria group bacterium Gr01-1014_18]TSC98243.1 MAG: large subunit ribosomal protein L5 [Parcubacteria group bacterium Greene1014_20]TSD07014.1 MAG: large subunit ribosomal protein L5 [Parcubacteria group bacterium Greene0714_2]
MSQIFKKQYKEKVLPALAEVLGTKNIWAVPRIKKIVVSASFGARAKDDSPLVVAMEKNLTDITGQRPIKTLAKTSISNFKIRKGMFLGYKITLRGKRMFDFIYKLLNINMPRIRDFGGISVANIDSSGNLNIGLKEQIAFLEIAPEGIEKLHGLEIAIVTSAKSQKEGLELFRLLGFPFKELKDKDTK